MRCLFEESVRHCTSVAVRYKKLNCSCPEGAWSRDPRTWSWETATQDVGAAIGVAPSYRGNQCT